MKDNAIFDSIIIGGGPGGYPAAIRLAQEGQKVAIIEKGEMGGTCLNRGCIPTKTLIAGTDTLKKVRDAHKFGIFTGEISFDFGKMIKRKDTVVSDIRKGLEGLLASNKIQIFNGTGKIDGPGKVKVLGKKTAILETKNIVIATGSEPKEVTSFPFDGKKIHNSTSLLELKKLPSSLIIVGGGYIGCEFASVFSELGVKVTIIEALDSILATSCSSVSTHLTGAFQKHGIDILTSTFVKSLKPSKEGVTAKLSNDKSITAEIALVSVGRDPNSNDLGLEKVGLSPNEFGFIPVNEKMETDVENIYAIGDVTGLMMLAHVASHQGLVAADSILGKPTKMHYNAIPAIVFTHPEIATVGLSLKEATEKGIPAIVGQFPFMALGKSQAAMEMDGFAQIITHKETGQIIGAQVVGHEAGTLIAEMGIAVANELTVDCLIETVHAHPSIAESWLEAALASKDTPLHLPPKKRAR